MNKIIIWGLFDSGNGSYYKAAKKLSDKIELYSIGLDVENKNNHFINLNLASYDRLFGEDELFKTLDTLPKPDVIIASPPCESWSIASAMKNGNACWKKEYISDSLFVPQTEPSYFTIRSHDDYEIAYHNYQYDRQFLKRVNGELTAFNTIEIIKRYNPSVYIIENPANSRIWRYFDEIIGFKILNKNLTRYNNYDYPLQKPTKFGSNINLELKNEIKKQAIKWGNFSKSYNERSNIPEKLVIDIFKKVHSYLFKKREEQEHD